VVAAENHPAEVVVLATPPSGGEEEALTVVQAARLAGASPTTVMRRITEGAIPATKEGGTWRIRRSEVLEFEFLKKRAVRPAVEREHARGMLAAAVFSLFRAAVPLDEVCERVEADPREVRALFEEWLRLRKLTAQWLSRSQEPALAPQFDHLPNEDGSCCAGHAVAGLAKKLEERTAKSRSSGKE
jgi:excisionase family DNA binding protein